MMNHTTTLLTFIHGFKGSDDTFDIFPSHLQDLLTKQLVETEGRSEQRIVIKIYPRYETRGNLPDAVNVFREWLVEQILTLEKENGNSSPIERPSVGVVLVGHSMGALVASDTLFSVLNDARSASASASGDRQTQSVARAKSGESKDEEEKEEAPRVEGKGVRDDAVNDPEKDRMTIFPAILGLLAFDTPFCGLSRAMFAYGAFAQYQQVSSAYGLVTSLSSLSFGGGSAGASNASASAADASSTAANTADAASAAGSSANQLESKNENNRPAWQLWQLLAMRTGAAGAIAAAGAAAYMNRERIGQGLGYLNKEDIGKGLSAVNRENIKQMFSQVSSENIQQGLAYISRENLGQGLAWLSGHLQFVGSLMKGQELQERIERLAALEGVGFADLYTSLGRNSYWSGGYFIAERTFVAVPAEKTGPSRFFVREVNTKAKDEIEAHTNMFDKAKNPGYDEMSERAKGLVLTWIKSHEARVLDPYPERRRRDMEKQVEVERNKAKYPGLTRYSYDDTKGFQESKAAGWIPSMSLPSMPGLPSYQGVTQYVPSMSWRRKQEDPPKEGGQPSDAKEDAPSAEHKAAEGEEKAEAVAQEAAEKPLPQEDEDLMSTLKRTGSVPGVTEDLVFAPSEAMDLTANGDQDNIAEDERPTSAGEEEIAGKAPVTGSG